MALAAFLFLAACGDDAKEREPEPSVKPVPPEPPLVAPEMPWVCTRPVQLGWDLEIWIPKAWQDGYKYENDTFFFPGPLDDGWRPELSFGWREKEKSLDAWAGERIRHLENTPGGRVLGKGDARIAGMAGRWFTYAFDRQVEGASQPMREINFYYAGNGGIGFVRGVSTARTFEKYLPIFREAAARLLYDPQ